MFHQIIQQKKNQWLQSKECTIIDLIKYIKIKAQLRDTQIEAIETYLFLKIKGDNKPLWELFSEGFFANEINLEKLNINQITRDFLKQNKQAFALYDFAKQQKYSQLENEIINNPDKINYENIIKSIFYNVTYADYLMSLPMGAGKTYLMAAFIYLDLYFADNEPQNKNFAHNFLVLIPYGLKNSIIPSLKTIQNFDPSWVLPEPAASKLKQLLKFDVLDEQKSAKKSNKARNPNAQKVNNCLPNPFGQIFVVNAEKVATERIDVIKDGNNIKIDFHENNNSESKNNDQNYKSANELRKFIGKIPHLSILIDEVHHATDSDLKLRGLLNEKWGKTGNLVAVLGFSGTPYLEKAEPVFISENVAFKFTQITNTVYYYPLVTAIKQFLKTPTIKTGQGLDRFQIIKNGIEDFNNLYKTKTYNNGTIAKIAIYCSTIEILENEIYPFLTTELQINPNEILKYHGGNKTYSLPKENELAFRSLDLAISQKRYILLVQVGKEGWDCPSLTGVILSQKGDSPQNMLLQTSCRCLRQVDKNSNETALIWLNKDNADMLNKQLKQEQNSSIDELNNARRNTQTDTIMRQSRMEYLEIPSIYFYQMKVNYQTFEQEKTANTREKLKQISQNMENFKTNALITTSGIHNLDTGKIEIVKEIEGQFASFAQWIFQISRESFNFISQKELEYYAAETKEIFDKIVITTPNSSLQGEEQTPLLSKEGLGVVDESTFFNDLYDLHRINAKIRLAFSIKKEIKTSNEIIPQTAQLLMVDNLKNIEKNKNLLPSEMDTNKILELDKTNEPLVVDTEQMEKEYQKMVQAMTAQGFGAMIPPFEVVNAKNNHSFAVKAKNNTFHYLPYDFGASGSSGFEMEIFQKILQLTDFQEKNLEIYYNGDNHLTQFKINCFAKNNANHWNKVGEYTTDFLIIKRNEKQTMHQILMIETKGAAFANSPEFLKRKQFVETEFLRQNKEKFNYDRFEFLYLEDSQDMTTNISKLSEKINQFFE